MHTAELEQRRRRASSDGEEFRIRPSPSHAAGRKVVTVPFGNAVHQVEKTPQGYQLVGPPPDDEVFQETDGESKRQSRMRKEEQCEPLKQESEQGRIEYKWKLIGKTPERIEHLVTQMHYRLTEGQGEAIYELGILDDGTPQGLPDDELAESISTIKHMAGQLKCDVVVLRIAHGREGKVAEVLVRKLSVNEFVDIRICVLGNVDAGKSTLIGVLTGGQLDNGRGLARMNVFRHRHEVENGRTSSVSHQILGFDSKGNITNHAGSGAGAGLSSGAGSGFRPRCWAEIVEQSSKIITFLDLAGHEAYLRTTMFGLLGSLPDYGLIAIAANNGVTRMTREHLGLAMTLRLPLFFVVTKIDLCPDNVLQETIAQITTILKSPDVSKTPVIVRTVREVLPLMTNKQLNATSSSLCPIFLISAVEGKGLKALETFLNLLPKQKDWSQFIDHPCEFAVSDRFSVAGVGTVVTGMVMRGAVAIGDQLLLGPDKSGAFSLVSIKSVHVKRAATKRAVAGQAASLALKKVKRSALRKGMVLMALALRPRACIGFDARIRVLSHPNSIQANYEPVVHCGTISQSARLVCSDPNELRTGDKATVRFNFVHRPEFLKEGARVVFREGRTKGAGRITRVYYLDEHKDEAQFRTASRSASRTAAGLSIQGAAGAKAKARARFGMVVGSPGIDPADLKRSAAIARPGSSLPGSLAGSAPAKQAESAGADTSTGTSTPAVIAPTPRYRKSSRATPLSSPAFGPSPSPPTLGSGSDSSSGSGAGVPDRPLSALSLSLAITGTKQRRKSGSQPRSASRSPSPGKRKGSSSSHMGAAFFGSDDEDEPDSDLENDIDNRSSSGSAEEDLDTDSDDDDDIFGAPPRSGAVNPAAAEAGFLSAPTPASTAAGLGLNLHSPRFGPSVAPMLSGLAADSALVQAVFADPAELGARPAMTALDLSSLALGGAEHTRESGRERGYSRDRGAGVDRDYRPRRMAGATGPSPSPTLSADTESPVRTPASPSPEPLLTSDTRAATPDTAAAQLSVAVSGSTRTPALGASVSIAAAAASPAESAAESQAKLREMYKSRGDDISDNDDDDEDDDDDDGGEGDNLFG